jgi:hypothetical protein
MALACMTQFEVRFRSDQSNDASSVSRHIKMELGMRTTLPLVVITTPQAGVDAGEHSNEVAAVIHGTDGNGAVAQKHASKNGSNPETPLPLWLCVRAGND